MQLGRPLENGDAARPAKKFQAEMNVGAVAMLADVRMALTDDSAQIVDARPAERFTGKAAEPRPGLRSLIRSEISADLLVLM